MPHRRLQNLYIALFLGLGAALCAAEVARQTALRKQIVLVDYVDSLREQGRRSSEILADAFDLARQSGGAVPAVLVSRLDQQVELLRSGHDRILSTIAARNELDPKVTAPIQELTPTLDEIENVTSKAHPVQIVGLITPLIEEYRSGLQDAAGVSFEQTRLSARTVSLFSLTLFALIAGLLLIEALFLILPASRSLRRQWNQLARSREESSRLSDRFKALIESTAGMSLLRGPASGDTATGAPATPREDDATVFDLSELRTIEAGLRLFEAAVLNSRDGVFIVECGTPGRIVFCNDAALELAGRSREDLIGSAPEHLHADDEETAALIRSGIAACGSDELECELVRPGGSRLHVEVDLVPVGADTEGPSHIVLVYRDVTEQVLSRRALQSSLDRFELIGRISVDGIYDLDLVTGECWRNEPLIRNFGKPARGQPFFEWLRSRIHEEDAEAVISAFREFTESDRSSWEGEYRQLRTDGTWARVRDRASLLRDSSGRPFRLVGCLQDVTEIRDQQWTIEKHNERLQQILDDQTELVCRYRRDGTLVFVNNTYAEFFGRSTEELVGSSILNLIPSDGHEVAQNVMDSLDADNPVSTIENRVQRADGSIRWMRWTDRVILNADDEVAAYQAVGRDVTEEMIAKRQLEEAESRYRAFIRNSYEAIFRIEIDPPVSRDLPPKEQANLIFERGRVVEANDAFSQQYGRSKAADSIGLSFADLFGHDDELISKNLEGLTEFVRDGYQVKTLDSHEARADGSTAIFSNSAFGTVEDGRLVRIWGTQRDVTEQRRTAQELLRMNNLLQLFVEHAPAAVAMFDHNMCYIAASERWKRDYGVSGELLAGRSHYHVFPEISKEWKQIHAQCLAGKSMSREEDLFERADGSSQWIRWDIRPWHDEAGEVGGVVMFTEDITERKLAADKLREVNAQQERLLTELDHRVKNALGALLSLIELGTRDQKDVASYAANIARRVRSMADVHAMLSESRWKPLALSEIVKNITPADTPGEIVPSGPEVKVPAQQATPLAMVLQELVSNSLKYGALSSPEGIAAVSWSTRGKAEDGSQIVQISWSERGGPPVEPNPSEGVGTQLIRGFARFELRGSIEFDYSEPSGVQHTLVCRLRDDRPSA